MDNISVSGECFIDEKGRERIFYGINFGAKNISLSQIFGSSRLDREKLNDVFSSLKLKGFNLIRYFVNWSVLEPEPDCYNEDALSQIKILLDVCEENDIYVILDMHQDLYTNESDADSKSHGDGAPYWACVTDGCKFRKPKFVWAENYFFSKAVFNCFDNFWNNTVVYNKGLQNHFCDLWRMLAERFSEHNALLGFDFFNEPYIGSDGKKIFNNIVKSVANTTAKDNRINKAELITAFTKKHPLCEILSQYDGGVLSTITASSRDIVKRFDEEKYMPFVNKVAASIRQVSYRPIIFTEHSYFSNLGIPYSGGCVKPDGKNDLNQAFAPHGYDFLVDTPLYKYADNSRVQMIFNQRRAEQLNTLKMPVLIGEWGGGAFNGEWLDHAAFLLDMFDSFKWSHCYWCCFNSIANAPVMNVLSRTHPVAVNGEIDNYSFDKEKNEFNLSFTQSADDKDATVVYCHLKPKKISSDCEYEIHSLGKYSSELYLYGKDGKHFLKINY